MSSEIERIRSRSGTRNEDLEINKVRAASEVFVHHVHVNGHPEVEVHIPIEWVVIEGNANIAFNAEGTSFLRDVQTIVKKYQM
jgi:hypothetical protein